MSPEQVTQFVDGCECDAATVLVVYLVMTTNRTWDLDYPCYELYTDVLRNGIFSGRQGKQLRLVVGRDRRVKEVERI
jgi:hypothetical protein